MCGICGTYAYGPDAPPVDTAKLTRMRDAMHRRGPDGQGLWLAGDGRAGFGHRRLSIIDLSEAGSQPMHDSDGRFVIVVNGEIYNYRELRDELAGAGQRFKSRSDTEVVLELFKREGTAAFARLRGMYALAIWDVDTRSLVLARDPFGIKPLYVADDGRTLRFASQVKALLTDDAVDTTADPAGHAGYFLWGHVPEPFTLYRAIAAFPAGHVQTIRPGHVGRPEVFADPAAVLRAAERSPRDSGADLHGLLFDSVAHHHVADVPVGVFLSAGRDSTAIAAFSTEFGGAHLRTFTLGFEDFRGTVKDEVPLAESVAATLHAEHTTEWIAGDVFAAARDDVLDVMDQPSVDGINTYFVAKLARGAGIKVALSGLGGDELFGGYPSFAEMPKAAAVIGAIPAGRAVGILLRRLLHRPISAWTSPKYAGLVEYGRTLGGAYLLRRALHMPWELAGILGQDMAEAGLARLAPLERVEQAIAGLRDPYLAVMLLEMTLYMRDRLLRDSDWASMAHSLELRVPLVDWQLFEHLAPYLAGRNRPRKSALSAAPRTRLPDAVAHRPKSGFEVPVRDWLLQGGDDGQTRVRGLRGWSRLVYGRFVGGSPVVAR